MQEVFKLIERVADTDSTILIRGESGTGKELVAKALHFNSRRQFAPFVPINCAALPENLLESELFGHRKGAFTGAINDKKGLFQEADGGTIFLDEISSMPAVLQSRLLRVLQEREVRRVGDNTPVSVNVRVLAATNEPLEERIKAGTFREDLFYRLNVIPIELPALRERLEDIPLLVNHFLREKVSARDGQPIRISRDALDVLARHGWPGNVRELENAIERASALCEDHIIRVRDLPAAVRGQGAGDDDSSEAVPDLGVDAAAPTEGFVVGGTTGQSSTPTASANAPSAAPGSSITQLRSFLRDQELAHINRALANCNNDKEKAAQLLGVSVATLYRKLAGGED